MKWFRDLAIAGKLGAICCLLALTAALIAWMGLREMSAMGSQSDRLYAGRLVPVEDLADANTAFSNQRINQREIVITRDAAKRRQLSGDIDTETSTLEARLKAYEKNPLSEAEQKQLREFRAVWRRYLELRAPVMERRAPGTASRRWR